MAKTACEEAAELHEEFARDINPKGNGAAWVIARHKERAKRLRAEGRELRRLRKLMLKAGDPENAVIDPDEFEREAARIQKARKK